MMAESSLPNAYQLRIAREEAKKVLALPENDPCGWLRHEMAQTILSLHAKVETLQWLVDDYIPERCKPPEHVDPRDARIEALEHESREHQSVAIACEKRAEQAEMQVAALREALAEVTTGGRGLEVWINEQLPAAQAILTNTATIAEQHDARIHAEGRNAELEELYRLFKEAEITWKNDPLTSLSMYMLNKRRSNQRARGGRQ